MKIVRLISVILAAGLGLTLHAGIAQAEIKTQYVDYKHGDIPLSGYLAYDDSIGGQRPGVLLVHHRGGFSDKTLGDAEMIAKLGYVVFALDMFGKGILPATVPEMASLIDIYNKDRPLMRTRAQAGFDVLRQNEMVDSSKLAIIGYCFGGTVAVELAETGVPLAGMVSVHGSFRDFMPEAAENIQGRVLILHGAEDTTAPLGEVNSLIADLRAANVDWELNLYSGVGHTFPSEERADRQYKMAVERFFKEIFGL